MIWKHHAKVNQLPELEAKLQYIRSWEALMDYGISYFIVRFSRAKKDVTLKMILTVLLCIFIYFRNYLELPITE
jgi:kindlin 2